MNEKWKTESVPVSVKWEWVAPAVSGQKVFQKVLLYPCLLDLTPEVKICVCVGLQTIY